MGQVSQKPFFTATGFLVWDTAQPERREYLDDETFAMPGTKDRHVTVTTNLAFALRQDLGGSPCRTFMSDMRLQVAAANIFLP